jgi:hypothetical protein
MYTATRSWRTVTRKRRVLEQATRWGWAMNHRVYASLVLRWLWTLPNGERSGSGQPEKQRKKQRTRFVSGFLPLGSGFELNLNRLMFTRRSLIWTESLSYLPKIQNQTFGTLNFENPLFFLRSNSTLVLTTDVAFRWPWVLLSVTCFRMFCMNYLV